jgi:hypothetical protein
MLSIPLVICSLVAIELSLTKCGVIRKYLVCEDSNVLNENEEMATHAYEGLVERRQDTMK